MSASDTQLLEAFVTSGSQEAFATLVGRHMGLVHGTARRMTGDGHLAEDVAQAVFILLAKKARGLSAEVNVAGWLHATTVLAVREAKRTEWRRRRRERAAARTETSTEGSAEPTEASAEVDKALAQLATADRDVLVLRYLEERSVDDVAATLGIHREAARKRLSRALGRLREAYRGVMPAGGAVVSAEVITRVVAGALGTGRVSGTVMGIVERTKRMLTIQRWMPPAMVGAAVAVALGVPVALMAFAGGATGGGGPATQVVATAAGTAPATRGKEITMDLLSPEAQKLWWFEPKHDHFTINKEGELVVHNAEAQGAALRGEIGGMALDNYKVRLEFFVDDAGTYGAKGRGGFEWNIQVAPRGTLVFCQVFPKACNICCWDPREKEPFRHLSDNRNTAYKPGEWNTLELFAEEGHCTQLLNGKHVAEADVPISTKGMLGLVVNFASDATVRIRKLELTLLEPTPEQVKELKTPALQNWKDWVAAEKAAGRPGKLSPVDDSTTTNRPLDRPTSGTEGRPGETQPAQ